MSKNGIKNHDEERVDETQDETDESVISEEEGSNVTQLKKQNTQLENSYKRALADYQNLEKRVREDKQNWIQLANRDLLQRLLPAIDMLQLAEKHTKDQGVKMTLQHVWQAFEQEGIQKIEVIDKKFNPETMEAVATGDGEEGRVIEELRAGYTIHGKVLRPSQVRVGKKEKE